MFQNNIKSKDGAIKRPSKENKSVEKILKKNGRRKWSL
jgi:hypothetical protein